MREGSDVTLFGTGMMTGFCVQAADLLAADGIRAEVVHLASIKPIDRDLIAASVRKTGCAVTAENASIVGGFGAAVAEVMGELSPAPLHRIGVRDRWIDSGSIGELLEYHQMQPTDIAQAARASIEARMRVRL